MPHLSLLIKVFSEARYADAFIRGCLYAQRLSYFKGIEDADGRGDEYEGAVLRSINEMIIMPRDPITDRIIDAIRIPEENLQGPMVMRTSDVDRYHLFCMSSAYVPDEDTEVYLATAVDEIDYILKSPKGIREFGKYAVVITKPKAFIQRVERVAKLMGISVETGLVNYYNEQRGTPAEPFSRNAIFNKRDKYAHQQEFRIAFDTGKTGSEPLILNIGDLGEMVRRFDIENNKGLDFRIVSSNIYIR